MPLCRESGAEARIGSSDSIQERRDGSGGGCGSGGLEWASWEAIPDVPPGFRKEDADPARMALKRKADEGFLQNPNNKKAKNNEASSDEEEDPRRWPDFDWERPVSIVPPTKSPPLQLENSLFKSLLII